MGVRHTFLRMVVRILSLGLLLAACQRQVPVVPPESGLLLEAESALRAGAYRRADELYQELGEQGGAREREISLARRALLYALPGTPLENRLAAESFLDQLLAEFPDSILRTDAQAVLAVLPDIESLRESGAEDRARAAELVRTAGEARREREHLETFITYASPFAPDFDIERARGDYRTLIQAFPDSSYRPMVEHMLFLLSQWDRYRALGADPEATIRSLGREVAVLGAELEKLKQIDLGRRVPE